MGAIGHGPGPKPKNNTVGQISAGFFGVICVFGALGIGMMAVDQAFGTTLVSGTFPPSIASLGGIVAWGLLIAVMLINKLLNGWTSILASLFVITIIATALGIYSISLALTALVYGIFAYGLFRL